MYVYKALSILSIICTYVHANNKLCVVDTLYLFTQSHYLGFWKDTIPTSRNATLSRGASQCGKVATGTLMTLL